MRILWTLSNVTNSYQGFSHSPRSFLSLVKIPKSAFFAFCFLLDAFCIDVEPKLMIPEAVSDVCMPSLLSLVIISVRWEWVGDRKIGRFKNIAFKMSLLPENKSGDSFNFYLQKNIVWCESSLNRHYLLI